MNDEMLVLQLDESHGAVIKNHEFANYSALKMIDLPRGIQRIEDYAFTGAWLWRKSTSMQGFRVWAAVPLWAVKN